MKKAIVIGGRGKVGSYLVPMLVEQGYAVVSVSRGQTKPYVESAAWDKVQLLTLDREKPGFEQAIAEQDADVVVDMICFTKADMVRLTDALKSNVSHYLVCGSAWMHGHSDVVPVGEEECREPLEEYGTQKSAMDREIGRLFREEGFPGTAVHPGHIVCPNDAPINPQGFNGIETFERIKNGEEICLPNFGMETLHHVHAADVAGVFMAAIRAGEKAFGEGFHAVSGRAVTLRGYAAEAAKWYGREAKLSFKPFEEWSRDFSEKDAAQALTHMLHSPSYSMEKAERVLGFKPAFTSYEAIRDCLKSFGL